ncbi:thioredoxin [Pycnococcus provasolii]
MSRSLLLLLFAAAAIAGATCKVGAAQVLVQQQTQNAAASSVVVLTDETFDAKTAKGVWLVDVYAPWCGHCKQLEPTWNKLAEELKAQKVNVAKVDGTKETTLLARFHVEAFPSIFLMKDGRTYVYEGQRSLVHLRAFALNPSKSGAKELAWYKAPNSELGRAMGGVYSLPRRANDAYQYLSKKRKWSDVQITLSLLAIPLVAGVILIIILDCFCVKGPYVAGGVPVPPPARPHAE